MEATPSTNSGDGVLLGSVTPRLWTEPLVTGPPGPCGCGCALDESTSDGFFVEAFARDVLDMELDEWERFLVIHAMELRPDGLPRFRHVLAIVARQSGKTTLLMILCLYWLFVERVSLVLSTSASLDTARESWEAGTDLAVDTPLLAAELPPTRNKGIRRTNGEQQIKTAAGSRWKISAANRRGGRGLSIDRLVLDELREHTDWIAWNASTLATIARPGSQVWAISNMGSDDGVVLDARRDAALLGDDPAHGLFEWSAPPGSHPLDRAAIAAANPNAGFRTSWDVLLGEGRAALTAGGEQLGKHLTEVLCLRIRARDPAVDPGRWGDLRDPHDLTQWPERLVWAFDLSPDGLHCTLAAGVLLDDERVAVDVVDAWTGPDCADRLRDRLRGIRTAEIKPRAIGWLPGGPAAAVAADMTEKKRGAHPWPPRKVEVEEIRTETASICMALAERVRAGGIAHPGDELIDAHILGAERLARGDLWVFSRKGLGHVDCAYAIATVVHLARTLPPPRPPLAIA